ncbi:MAG: protein kinase [Rhizobiaceae bacterium]|nr:protein kinase [Rhizobiaceae bacterium]MCV0405800.1 protein kinase [Rhizobiaceae bacterium]
MSDDDNRTRIVPEDGNGNANGVGPGVQLNGMYEIDERLAFGGMGEVYRGHNIQTGDPVAIKIVLAEFARDESILALFRKEASILNHLSHDAIVRYHVFSRDPVIERHYLAMEFVDGVALSDRMADKPLTPREARRLLRRIASGLALAHEAGVIHRDLSPDNIILPGGNVNKSKIIDFGIARSANVGGGTLLGGKFAGKYNFVSPEQLGLFGGDVTERSDIYSLGLVIAGALRGEPLDMSGSQVEVIEKRRTVPDLSHVDDGLRPLIHAMLQPDPEHRPESAEDIVEWLRATAERSIPPVSHLPGLPPAGVPAGLSGSQPPYQGGSQTPFHGQGSYPGSQPPAGSQPPGYARSQPPTGSEPIPYPGSQPPYPGSQPPAGSLPPAGSQPPYPAPPPAAHETAPQRPANVLPPRRPQPAAPAPRKSSAMPMIAAGVLLLLVAGGAGAYMAGLFDPAEPNVASNLPTLNPAGDRDGADGANGEGETGEQGAASQPDPEPEPERVEDGAAWLADYRPGGCFHARPIEIADDAARIEAFAGDAARFDRLVADYREATGVEPDVTRRLIAEPQCPVLEFMNSTPSPAGAAPALTLSVDRLKFGDTLTGQFSGGGRQLNLLLIDDEGVVYDLVPFMDDGQFSIKLADPEAGSGNDDRPPSPQLVVALASPEGIGAAQIRRAVRAGTAFEEIGKELRSIGDEAGYTVRHFILEK